MGADVGHELLSAPVPQMVYELSQAIAKGQLALDTTSINTLKILANTKFDYLPEITETLTPHPITTKAGPTVTGTDVEVEPTRTFPMTLLQAGILPTFYQFTETLIEVKISISSHTETKNEFEFGAEVKAEGNFLFGSASFASHVNYKTASTYSYNVEGSSLIRVVMRPAPMPTRAMPKFITVNTLVSPPQITTSQ
jgi:hypothetical protein